MKKQDAIDLVVDELDWANERFGSFASKHEGLAVVEEEFLELRDEIFWGRNRVSIADDPDARHLYEIQVEAKQLAAMAIRLLMDCIPESMGRNGGKR